MESTLNDERINVRLPKGTGEIIDSLLYGGELRSVFVRVAVAAEIRRRQAEKLPRGQKPASPPSGRGNARARRPASGHDSA
jgi:hypothetical protein